MKKHLQHAVLLIAIVNSISLSGAIAKDASELDEKANNLESHAANNEAKSMAEQNESSTAIDEGKRGKAANYAHKAARDQSVANKYAKQAHKTEKKAAEKSVKESY